MAIQENQHFSIGMSINMCEYQTSSSHRTVFRETRNRPKQETGPEIHDLLQQEG
jgi:hypothetical protein